MSSFFFVQEKLNQPCKWELFIDDVMVNAIRILLLLFIAFRVLLNDYIVVLWLVRY